jgi:hypothetical protein
MKGVRFVDVSSAKRCGERVEILILKPLRANCSAKGWPSQPLPIIDIFLMVISSFLLVISLMYIEM